MRDAIVQRLQVVGFDASDVLVIEAREDLVIASETARLAG